MSNRSKKRGREKPRIPRSPNSSPDNDTLARLSMAESMQTVSRLVNQRLAMLTEPTAAPFSMLDMERRALLQVEGEHNTETKDTLNKLFIRRRLWFRRRVAEILELTKAIEILYFDLQNQNISLSLMYLTRVLAERYAELFDALRFDEIVPDNQVGYYNDEQVEKIFKKWIAKYVAIEYRELTSGQPIDDEKASHLLRLAERFGLRIKYENNSPSSVGGYPLRPSTTQLIKGLCDFIDSKHIWSISSYMNHGGFELSTQLASRLADRPHKSLRNETLLYILNAMLSFAETAHYLTANVSGPNGGYDPNYQRKLAKISDFNLSMHKQRGAQLKNGSTIVPHQVSSSTNFTPLLEIATEASELSFGKLMQHFDNRGGANIPHSYDKVTEDMKRELEKSLQDLALAIFDASLFGFCCILQSNYDPSVAPHIYRAAIELAASVKSMQNSAGIEVVLAMLIDNAQRNLRANSQMTGDPWTSYLKGQETVLRNLVEQAKCLGFNVKESPSGQITKVGDAVVKQSSSRLILEQLGEHALAAWKSASEIAHGRQEAEHSLGPLAAAWALSGYLQGLQALDVECSDLYTKLHKIIISLMSDHQANSHLTAPAASAPVYRFTDGRWRQAEANPRHPKPLQTVWCL